MGQIQGLVQRLGVLMTTVFVDMIGFAIVLPLLPYYALRFGATPFVVGLLVAAFPLAQLTSAPMWGKLSDRWGRRPVILSGLLVSATAFVVFALAQSLWLLLASRLVQGVGGGTNGVVQAYVGDSIPARDRAAGLGWLTAASSAGIMLGPAVASLASGLGPAAPGLIAAVLCLANFVFARWRLPESVGRHRGAARPDPGFVRRAVGTVIRHPFGPVSSLVWVYSAGLLAFMALNGVLALYLDFRFGITERTIGWFYLYVGSISVVARALVLGRLVRRFGELRVMRMGALSLAVGMALIPLVERLWALALPMMLVPLGTALLFPSSTSLVSQRVPEAEMGRSLGVMQAFGGGARLLGPVWAGAAFQQWGPAWPYFLAAAVMAVVTLLAGSLREADGEFSLGAVASGSELPSPDV